MRAIPYIRKTIITTLSKKEIESKILQTVSDPDWKINIDKIMNHRLLTGKTSSNHFYIATERYALSYGKTSLLPILKGKIRPLEGKLKGSSISFVIRPIKMGIAILSFFYFLCLLIMIFSIIKGLIAGLIVSIIFLSVTYFYLILHFNYEAKIYLKLMQENFS
jgi:hypothetical protein